MAALAQQPCAAMRVKSYSAFINIAYQDAKNKGIDASFSKQFQKSLLNFGDKELIEDMLVRLFLTDVYTTPNFTPTLAYVTIANSCPAITTYPLKNPYLIAVYTMVSYIKSKGGNFFLLYYDYIKWQKDNLSNAPVGSNEVIGNVSKEDASAWQLSNTQNWVTKHRDEYVMALTIYTNDYDNYVKVNGPISHYNFFKKTISEIGRFEPEEISSFVDNDFYYYKPSVTILPTKEFMVNNPALFVKNAYQNLFMRAPTAEEMNTLVTFINETKELTPRLFYYSLMTSEEYKSY